MSISKHEEKMVNLQYQLRNNQAELQDYLKDLDSWTNDIKEKEEGLKSGQTDKKQALPPVRNTIHKKKLKKKKKEKPVDAAKPKKISGFDFRAWDKFDVDKALQEIDEEGEKKKDTSSSEYETDEEWEMERKKHLAGLEKDKGNAHLKNGEYDLAVEAYTKGMSFDATNAILPANRALALLKQQKFAAAELDCTTSISLDPLYVKAYLRRATARSGMGKLDEAVSDYNRVLDLEPANKQAKTEIERLNKELERGKAGHVSSSLTEGDRGIVKPIYKPPEERSKVPLKRIAIEEIGLEQSGRPQSAKLEQSEMAKKITAKEGKEFDKLLASSSSSSSVAHPSNQTQSSSQPKDAAVESVSSKVSESSRLMSEETVCANSKISDKGDGKSSAEQTKGTQDLPGITKPSADKAKNFLNHDKSSGKNSPSESVAKNDVSKNTAVENGQRNTVPPLTNGSAGSGDGHGVPQTSFQFQGDFKLLKNKPESFYKYFKVIPPSQYAKLFGQCLDADILNAILKCLTAFGDRGDLNVYEVLHQLTFVKRFSVTAMFLSQKDKQVARDLIEQLLKKGTHSASEIASLKQKYDL